MERLEGAVRKVLRTAGVPDAGQLAALTSAWPGAVGEAIAASAWPLRLTRDGTLVVAARSASWAFELGRMAPEILERLRETDAGNAPAALRFVPGPIPEPGSRAHPERPPSAVAIDPAALEQAEAAAAAIGDPELRATVARAAAASLSRTTADRRF